MGRNTGGIWLLATFVALGALAGAAVGTAGATAEDGDDASLGTEISSFMQASSAETATEVDDGRFEAAMNRTDDDADRRALIEERQAVLEANGERLRAQRETVGAASDVRNRSLATRVVVGAAGLERSVNGTERAATEAGLDTERLAEIRANARDMRGEDVADLARGLAGPSGVPGSGPPAENRTGPPDGAPSDPGGGDAGSAPDDSGAPDGADDGPSDAGDGGPPDDPGHPDDGSGEDDAGPPDDAGSDDDDDAEPPDDAGSDDQDTGPPDDASSDDDGDAGSSDDAGSDTGPDNGSEDAPDDTGPDGQSDEQNGSGSTESSPGGGQTT